MNILDIGLILLLAAWLVATVVNQLSYPWAKQLTAWDHFRMLPRWTFFAPNPGTSDYHLLYRQIHSDGQVTAFVELPLHVRRRGSYLFNPDKRVKKALLDLSHIACEALGF